MAKLSNIDTAYEFLKAKKNKAKFDDIVKAVIKENKIEPAQKTAVMASLYSGLVLDNRFSLTPDGSWALRSNLKFEDVKKQYANLEVKETKKPKASIEEELEDAVEEAAIENEDEDDYGDDEEEDDDDATISFDDMNDEE